MSRILRTLATAAFLLIGSGIYISAKTYVVAVGIGYYQEQWLESIAFGPGDARSIAKIFNDHRDADVFMLLNDNATRDHILRVLKSKFSQAKPEDEIIFVYTGHGFDGGFSGYGKDETIFNYEIQNIMKASKASRKMIFMGNCHSGSLAKKYQNNTPERQRNNRQNSNVILFMSSRPNENSWGNANSECSCFIKHVSRGLLGAADANKDNKVTVRELFNYVSPHVISETGGKQHPQILGQFDDDMIIISLPSK